jgi:hypothetical protein
MHFLKYQDFYFVIIVLFVFCLMIMSVKGHEDFSTAGINLTAIQKQTKDVLSEEYLVLKQANTSYQFLTIICSVLVFLGL